jgi:hypothetical protein
MTDKRIETYLQKSTRGLWGKKRDEVREELSSHIQGRVHAHLVGGLCESDAVEKTLTELGHPTHVSAGMARLYTLPVVAGSGMVLAMCSALVVVMLSGSTAQTLQMFDVFPTEECLESARIDLSYPCKGGGWTNIESLKEVLEPQGVKFKQTENFWAITFPEGEPLVLNTDSVVWSFFNEVSDEPITLKTRPDHILIRDFISALHLSMLPVKIKGWEKPIITVGNTSFDIDLVTFAPETNYDEPLYTSKDFYSEPIYWEIFNSLPKN